MILYYDRDGAVIDDEQRAWRLMGDMDYKRVARTSVMDGADPSKAFDVSTVWLGLDHAFSGGPPLIFETMVFAAGSSSDLECERYATEAQAREGHTAMVVSVSAGLTDPIVMDAE